MTLCINGSSPPRSLPSREVEARGARSRLVHLKRVVHERRRGEHFAPDAPQPGRALQHVLGRPIHGAVPGDQAKPKSEEHDGAWLRHFYRDSNKIRVQSDRAI